jgi:hypothetical protein
MARMIRALLFSFVVAACGGGAKPPPAQVEPPKPDPIPVTAGPTCKAVAEHIAIVNNLPDDLRPQATALLETRCTEDKWTDEVRSCFNTAQSGEEGEACAKEKLTKDQLAAVERDIEKLMAEHQGKQGEPATSADKAPPPPPDKKSKGTTRGATKKPKAGDPCQGGESDPCQGGQ